jgi:hypothetical protein
MRLKTLAQDTTGSNITCAQYELCVQDAECYMCGAAKSEHESGADRWWACMASNMLDCIVRSKCISLRPSRLQRATASDEACLPALCASLLALTALTTAEHQTQSRCSRSRPFCNSAFISCSRPLHCNAPCQLRFHGLNHIFHSALHCSSLPRWCCCRLLRCCCRQCKSTI